MSQSLNLRCKGLVTHPNSMVPDVSDGALVYADNVVIDKENVVESRRGFSVYGTSYFDVKTQDQYINSIWNYKDKLLVNSASHIAYDANDEGEFHPYLTEVTATCTDANVDTVNDLFTINAHPFSDGDAVTIHTSGTYPTPFESWQTYYVVGKATNTFQLAYTYQGDALDILDAGSGTFTFTKIMEFTAPATDYRMHSVEANRNIYVNTSTGLKKLDKIDDMWRDAGVPQALDGKASLNTSSGTGWFLKDTAVAYRMVWYYTDHNENLVMSAPSSRLIVDHPADSLYSECNVDLTYLIPEGITTDHYYQIYRSIMTESASGTPVDEMQMVLEGQVTSGQILAAEFTVTDNTPESLRGAILYTSTSQEGIQNSNYTPPYCKDMTTYKGSILYANTKTKHRMTSSLVAVGGPSGVNMGDTITIGGTTYTAGAIENSATDTFSLGTLGYSFNSSQVDPTANTITIADQQFLDYDIVNLYSADLPSPLTPRTNYYVANVVGNSFKLSLSPTLTPTIDFVDAGSGDHQIILLFDPANDIRTTAESLVKIMNKSTVNNSVYAYYTSGYDELPGKMMFEEVSIGGSAFYATSSFGTAFNPALPTSGTKIASSNEEKPNRVFISKQFQPEAVPLYSYVDVGSADQPISRILALRDSVFIFKNDGIFRLIGEDLTSFKVSLFDNTTRLLGPESAVAFNNQVFCMSLQGVIAVSDTGVAVVSRPIEYDLLQLISAPYFGKTTFGVAYESDRKYILWTVSSDSDTFPTQAFVYNSFTNSWTKWRFSATCGLVNKHDDKLYYGSKGVSQLEEFVYQERKDFSMEDYVDDEYEIQIEGVNGKYLTVNSTDNAVVGYWIRQVNHLTLEKTLAKITAIDVLNKIITVDKTLTTWSINTADLSTIYKPITCRIKWLPIAGQNPGILKQFTECTLLFRQPTSNEMKIGFETNFRPDYDYVLLSTYDTGQWGGFGFGTLPWNGVDHTFVQALRCGVPLQKQRCSWIQPSIEASAAFNSFSCAGISLQVEGMSERFKNKG